MPHDFAGARVRYWRLKRGLSQQALAGLIGMSQGYVSQIEAGIKEIDKRSTLVHLADALQVSVADLTGAPHVGADQQHAPAVAAVAHIRAALIGLTYLDLPDQPDRTTAELRADLKQLMLCRRTCEYSTAAPIIAPLLVNLGAAANQPDTVGADRAEILRLLALTAHNAAFVLKYLGFVDLSLSAYERCHLTAVELGEPEWLGLAEYTRLQMLPPESQAVGRKLAAATADRLQADLANPRVRQTYGMLHLSAAWGEAMAGAEQAAQDHLAEAREAARSLGPDPLDGGFAQMNFGPTNVAQWRASMALQSGDAGKAVELARAIDTKLIHSTSRLAQFHIELGSALTVIRHQDAEALAHFVRAERLAPQRVRLSPVVRDKVEVMLRRARADASGVHVRELAARVGIA